MSDKENEVTQSAVSFETRDALFQDLWDEHVGWVKALCTRRMINGSEAEIDEAIQRTFIQTWKGLEAFRGTCKVKNWMYRIALNETGQLLRERNKHQVCTELTEAALEIPEEKGLEEAITEKPLLRAITDLLKHLPPADRRLVVLRCVHDMSRKEIAAELGVSKYVVQSRLIEVRKKLRRIHGRSS